MSVSRYGWCSSPTREKSMIVPCWWQQSEGELSPGCSGVWVMVVEYICKYQREQETRRGLTTHNPPLGSIKTTFWPQTICAGRRAEKKHLRCRKSWSSFSHDALAYRCKQTCKYVQFTCKKGLKGENVYSYEKKVNHVWNSHVALLYSHVKNANYMWKCDIHMWSRKLSFHVPGIDSMCENSYHIWIPAWYSHLNVTFIHKWKSQSLVNMSVSHVTFFFFTCEKIQMYVKIISCHLKLTREKGSFCIWHVCY